jgi:ABC-type uncharacterized transport system permease subunit
VTLGAVLFSAVLTCYFVASVCYHAHLFAGSPRTRRLAPIALAVGLVLHSIALGQRWFEPNTPPMPPAVRVATTMAWTLALVQLLLDWRLGWAAIGSLSVPLAFFLVFSANFLPPAAVPAGELHSRLLRPHLVVLILGFAGFALAFCLAVVYLVQASLLKRKQVRGIFGRLPPLATMDTAAHWLAAVAFSMLTLGIVTGALVAVQNGEADWYRQPRVVASFLAWLVYAVYIAASTLGGWRGRKTTYFLIGGFAVLVVAYAFNLR